MSDTRTVPTAELPCRVLVVAGNTEARHAIAAALDSQGYEVIDAGSAGQALALVRQARPSVVLLDIALPDRPGLELCRVLRRQDSRIGIILLSDLPEEADAVRGLAHGADDYVVKPVRLQELVARVGATTRRVRLTFGGVKPDRIAFKHMTIDVDERRVLCEGKPVTLTHTEFELLLLLASNPGRAVTREAILQAVWSDEESVDVASRVVDVHVRNLRKKIEPQPSRPFYILAVPGIGYRFTNARSRPAASSERP
jgi:DNA-binding response OmpR family regulator